MAVDTYYASVNRTTKALNKLANSGSFVHARDGARGARVSVPALLASAGLAVVFAGVIGYFVLTGARAQDFGKGGGAGGGRSGVGVEVPPDIRDLNATGGQGLINRLSSGTGFFMQVADRDDPSRVAAEITADRSEPMDANRYRMEKPKAWAFMNDGRTLYVEAERGQARIPADSKDARPEEGTLEGDVVIRLYERLPDDARPKPGVDRPSLTARTTRIDFDATLGQIVAADRIMVDGDQVDFVGAGLTLVYSEAAERVELLRILTTEKLVIKPKPARRATVAGASDGQTSNQKETSGAIASASPSGGEVMPPAGQEPKASVETLYQLVASDTVRVAQGGRVATGQILQGWLRLIDNAIPEGATGAVASAGAGSKEVVPSGGEQNGEQSGTANETADGTRTGNAIKGEVVAEVVADEDATTADQNKPIELTWKGVLEARPVASTEMLARDHIAIALASELPGGVVLTDAATGASAHGTRLAYGATSREISIASDANVSDASTWALIESPKSGQLRAPRIEISLAKSIARIPGPGWLLPDSDSLAEEVFTANADQGATLGATQGATQGAARDVAQSSRGLRWSREAEFTFAGDPARNNQMTGVITRALLAGDVVARDDKGSLQADTLVANFTPTSSKLPVDPAIEGLEDSAGIDLFAKGSGGGSRLAHIQAVGSARLEDGNEGGLAARQIDIAFIEGTDETVPASIQALGGARAWRKDTSLKGGTINAALAKDEQGKLVATNVLAQGSVEFEDGPVSAWCDKLVANPVTQEAELSGYATRIVSGTSNVTGALIRLDGIKKTMGVDGAGAFNHADPARSDGLPIRTATATWTKGMTFDDLNGVLECNGETVTVLSQGVLARDTMNADRVIARFQRSGGTLDASNTLISGGLDSGGLGSGGLDSDGVDAGNNTASPVNASASSANAGTSANTNPWGDLVPIPAAGPRVVATQPVPEISMTSGTALPGVALESRTLTMIEAFGSEPDASGVATNARLESRRYESGQSVIDPNPPLERLIFLESSYIVANNTQGSIDTSGLGRLLFVDRTDEEEGASTNASRGIGASQLDLARLDAASMRGDALFTWTDSLSMDRALGIITMRGSTRLVHRDPTGSTFAEVEGDTLTARMSEDAPQGPLMLEAPFKGQFLGAVVSGSAWLRHDGRELVADALSYDAMKRTVDANALPGRVVTLLDPSQPAPTAAQRIFWDLANDRIDVTSLSR